MEEILRRAEMSELDEVENEEVDAQIDADQPNTSLDPVAADAQDAEPGEIEDGEIEDGELKEEIAAARKVLRQTGKLRSSMGLLLVVSSPFLTNYCRCYIST